MPGNHQHVWEGERLTPVPWCRYAGKMKVAGFVGKCERTAEITARGHYCLQGGHNGRGDPCETSHPWKSWRGQHTLLHVLLFLGHACVFVLVVSLPSANVQVWQGVFVCDCMPFLFCLLSHDVGLPQCARTTLIQPSPPPLHCVHKMNHRTKAKS